MLPALGAGAGALRARANHLVIDHECVSKSRRFATGGNSDQRYARAATHGVRGATHTHFGGCKSLYAFRQSLPQPIALQAPHSFQEYHTRQIVLDMMLEASVAAAAWNTVLRLIKQYGATINADLSLQEYSFFKAFSRAFAIHYANGRVLQIHGFAQQKRTT